MCRVVATIIVVDTLTKLFFLFLLTAPGSGPIALGALELKLAFGESAFGYSERHALAEQGLSQASFIAAAACVAAAGALAHIIKGLGPFRENRFRGWMLFALALSPCFVPMAVDLGPEPLFESRLPNSTIRILSSTIIGTLLVRTTRQRYLWIFAALAMGGSASNYLNVLYHPVGVIDWLSVPFIDRGIMNLADLAQIIGKAMVLLWLPLWALFGLARRLPSAAFERAASWLFAFERTGEREGPG